MLRFIQGLMWARRESIGGHSPVGGPQMDTGVISIRVAPTATTGAGNQTGMQSIPDNADAQANKGELLGVVARLQGFSELLGDWNRLRAYPTDSDDVTPEATGAVLGAASFSMGFHGGFTPQWERLRSASDPNLQTLRTQGAMLVSSPGEWTAHDAPAAATMATATRAAAPGTSQVCRSITVSIATVAAQAPLEFVLRDGATGVGAIRWRLKLSALAGDCKAVTISGLNIYGTGGNAMTLESVGAPAAGNFATVSMTGNIAG